jgi:hypothetical protein
MVDDETSADMGLLSWGLVGEDDMSFKCSLVLFFGLTTAACSGGGNCFHDPDYDKDTREIQECLDIPTTTNITTGTTKKCKIGKPCGNSCIAMNKTCHK